MQRLTQLSDRESSPGDSGITRSSTEAHEDLAPRDMSVADHCSRDLNYGKEISPAREALASDIGYPKHFNINNSELYSLSRSQIRLSPKAYTPTPYTPTPYSKPSTQVSEAESVDIKATASEMSIHVESPPAAYISKKVPSYYTLVPYSRSVTPYSPVNWQSPVNESEYKGRDTKAESVHNGEDTEAGREHKGDEAKAECDVLPTFPQKCDDAKAEHEQNRNDAMPECANSGGDAKVEVEHKNNVATSEYVVSCDDVTEESEHKGQIAISENAHRVDGATFECVNKGDDVITKELEQVCGEPYQKPDANELSVKDSVSTSSPDTVEPFEATIQRTAVASGLKCTEDETDDQMVANVPARIEHGRNVKETRLKEILITTKSFKEFQNAVQQNIANTQRNKKHAKTTNFIEQNKKIKTGKGKKTEIKEKPPSESAEMHKLKRAFDEHLRGREQFDQMIEKRDQDIDEQLRELDEILESVKSERFEVEKAVGEFAETMKIYTNFRDEATRVRVKHLEQELSAEILSKENEELQEQARELYDQINEIKERRAIGLDGLNKESEEMKCAAEMLMEKNAQLEAEIKSKVEEFNQLKTTIVDKGVTYITTRKPVQKTGWEFHKPTKSLSPPLRVSSCDSSSLNSGVSNFGDDITLQRHKCDVETEESTNNSDTENNASDPPGQYKSNVCRGIETYQPDIGRNGARFIDSSAESFNTPDKEKENRNDFVNEANKWTIQCQQATKQFSSATDLVSSSACNIRKRKSRIPKPILEPYGSASRHGDRFVVSKSCSLAVIESGNYKRENFVPEDERHVTKPTMNYIDPEIELRKLRKRRGITDDEDVTRCFKNLNPTPDNERMDPLHVKDHNEASYSVVKHTPHSIKKKEIKSKIDTGLKSKPNKTTISKNAIVTSGNSVTRKNKTDAARRDCTSYTNRQNGHANSPNKKGSGNAKEGGLPPLKITPKARQDADKMPELSRSFDEKVPLPEIKRMDRQGTQERTPLPPISRKIDNVNKLKQKAANNKGTGRRSSGFTEPLPPITRGSNRQQELSPTVNEHQKTSRAMTPRLPPITCEQNQARQTKNDIQRPEAIWISVSPSSSSDRNRKRSERGHNSPRESDMPRVSPERA